MMSAWIIVDRFPASSGGKTLASICRDDVPVWSAAKRSAEKKIPIAVLRPSSATAMPTNPTALTWMSFVAIVNFQPRLSSAPPRPANPPAIASARM